MYLTKKTDVKKWEFKKPEEQYTVVITKGNGCSNIKEDRIVSIVEDVAYWRKANAIHNWFVENVQQNEDDCEEYALIEEDMIALRDLCRQVLAASKLIPGKVSTGYTFDGDKKVHSFKDGQVIEDSSVAEELLPTAGGFFFGQTSYDEDYYEDIRYTEETLTKLLEEGGEGCYYYQSSW